MPTNDKSVESAEIHKPPTIIVTVTKTVFPDDIFEEGRQSPPWYADYQLRLYV